MKPMTKIYLIVFLALFSTTLFATSPPENTIPIVGLKPSFEEIDTEFFCLLSWHNFDGLSRQGYSMDDILNNVVLPGDTTGMLTLINPWTITCQTQWYSHMFAMNTDSAYAWPVWNTYTFEDTTYTEDGLRAKRTAAVSKAQIEGVAEDLEEYFNDNSHSVWFYYGYDEAPAWQWNRMITDSIDHVYSGYDNYMPSLFTQEMDSVYRPDIDSTMKWQPTFEHVDYYGVLSWMGRHINQEDSTRQQSFIISAMHTMKDWAGANNIVSANNYTPPNSATQAQVVRSLFSMQYRAYNPSGPQPDAVDNYPSFIALDAYPFRLVGTRYQVDSSYTQQLGDSLENCMLDHYAESIDSTFITAWNIRNSESKDISVFFVPQSFGRAGGSGMWDVGADSLLYDSYNYRIPTPQEFLMTCNSSLILQAKALLPYCLTTYMGGEGNHTDAGLLDGNNIPFNAPYEEWVYRDRPTDDITFIPPDSFAPFIDGYDPLYDLPDRPTPVGQKETEILLKWKFAAYGRLWNSVKQTFGSIARVAPELALLDWWEDSQDDADISYDGAAPQDFRGPQIKVFTDSTESDCYLYYLNRFCRANNNPFEIVVDADDFQNDPPFSEYALDHSRRFIIEGDMTGRDIYTFLDTLDAGEARLLQMFDESVGLDADVRITDPDVNAILPAKGDTLLDNRSPVGENVDIIARFYNMGTESQTNIWVYLYDETDEVKIDSTRISFNGLSTDTCWTVDRTDVIFDWTPTRSDIGVHILKVYADTWLGEPDPNDNSAHLVYIVDPADFATEKRDDPWDMTEATTSIPDWYTDDISAIGGLWKSISFTDSISGMFEGALDPAISGTIFRGDISLAIPEDSTINTDDFYNLSFGAVCMNPNSNATTAAGSVLHLWWIDSEGDTLTANLSNEIEIGAIRNGTDQWKTYGPLDLSTVSGLGWATEEASEFWLSFRSGKPAAPEVPKPIDIRIGWVKLTE